MHVSGKCSYAQTLLLARTSHAGLVLVVRMLDMHPKYSIGIDWFVLSYEWH